MSVTTWVSAEDVGHRIDSSYYQREYVDALHRIRSHVATKELGEIAPQICNGPHGGVQYVAASAGVLYLRAKDLEELTIVCRDPVFISFENHQSHVRGEVRPGDILVTVTGANIGDASVVPSSIRSANIIQSLAKVRIESDDDPFYVAAYLSSHYGNLLLRREGVNTAREGINFEYLGRVEIPLPAIEVQTSIGDKVRESHRCKHAAQQAIDEAFAMLDNQLGAIDVSSPDDQAHAAWNWVKTSQLESRVDAEFYRPEYIDNESKLTAVAPCVSLDELREASSTITNGIRGPELKDSDYRMLRLQDVDGLWLDSSKSLRVSESQYLANRRAWCIPGDVLMAIGGYIGVVGEVIDNEPQTMGQHSARIRFDRSKVDPEYMLAFLASPVGTLLCQRYVSGGVQAGINLEDVRQIRVPVLDRDAQELVGDRVRAAEDFRRRSRMLLKEALASIGQVIDGDYNRDDSVN